jgi:hypothetical protein
VPIGLGITVVVVAFVSGAGGASLIQGATPGYAWVAAPGLCGSLFVVARWVIRSAPTPARVVALIALACLTFSYLLVLGGESAPRPTDRSGISHFTFVVLLLAVFVAAAALPAFVVGAALRFGRAHEPHQLHLDVSPQLLSAATGTVMFLLGLLLLVTVLWASSPQWRVLAIVSVAIGSPVLLLPFGAYMYERLLSRWRVDRLPRALLEGLEKLRDSTGLSSMRSFASRQRSAAAVYAKSSPAQVTRPSYCPSRLPMI